MDNDKVLADFTLEDGEGFIRIEVPKPVSNTADATEEVSVIDNVLQAPETFEEALAKIQPVVERVAYRLRRGLTAEAKEVQVKFGLNLSVESGVIISSVGGSVNFEVTLTWKE